MSKTNPLNLSTIFGTFLCSHRKNNVVKFDRNGIAIVAFHLRKIVSSSIAIVATRFVENIHAALAPVFCMDIFLRTDLTDTFAGKNIGFPS